MPFLERFMGAYSSALAVHARRYGLEWALFALAVAGFSFSAWLLVGAPRPFPSGAIVTVAEKDSGATIARKLYEAHIVREPRLLELFWRISGTDKKLRAGAYRFNAPENLFTIAGRLARGTYGIPPVKVTFPEGATVIDMGKRVAKALPGVSLTDFISVAGPYEGYLYPDSYTLQPSATAESIVALARKTFEAKVGPLDEDIAASGHSLQEIVTLASIVEREARVTTDRKMIAGIMWNRIERGMPLQVDAVFGYIYSRATYSPSYRDLGVDSPYNTYTHKGLPPGPISNPSLDSIKAVLTPTKSKYLFYLTGRDGLMHYATTYQGHKANLNAYLR
jgi:UPF0755 protein